MKLVLLTLLILAYTAASAALLSIKPKMATHGNAAQAMCMAGDTARNCWHYLEHRSR